jgi:hypothetical protein
MQHVAASHPAGRVVSNQVGGGVGYSGASIPPVCKCTPPVRRQRTHTWQPRGPLPLRAPVQAVTELAAQQPAQEGLQRNQATQEGICTQWQQGAQRVPAAVQALVHRCRPCKHSPLTPAHP